mmetsp:Transcript_39237/g.91004  ORF Transcript_39237/g.91004 Transcript_39237/m.91004 type:complete len:238 (+) Transcript_39237:68-781(+)
MLTSGLQAMLTQRTDSACRQKGVLWKRLCAGSGLQRRKAIGWPCSGWGACSQRVVGQKRRSSGASEQRLAVGPKLKLTWATHCKGLASTLPLLPPMLRPLTNGTPEACTALAWLSSGGWVSRGTRLQHERHWRPPPAWAGLTRKCCWPSALQQAPRSATRCSLQLSHVGTLERPTPLLLRTLTRDVTPRPASCCCWRHREGTPRLWPTLRYTSNRALAGRRMQRRLNTGLRRHGRLN